jgi:hypothetical protein
MDRRTFMSVVAGAAAALGLPFKAVEAVEIADPATVPVRTKVQPIVDGVPQGDPIDVGNLNLNAGRPVIHAPEADTYDLGRWRGTFSCDTRGVPTKQWREVHEACMRLEAATSLTFIQEAIGEHKSVLFIHVAEAFVSFTSQSLERHSEPTAIESSFSWYVSGEFRGFSAHSREGDRTYEEFVNPALGEPYQVGGE